MGGRTAAPPSNFCLNAFNAGLCAGLGNSSDLAGRRTTGSCLRSARPPIQTTWFGSTYYVLGAKGPVRRISGNFQLYVLLGYRILRKKPEP
jgi:hypothetical protein